MNMKKSIKPILVVVSMLAALALAGCGGGPSTTAQSAQNNARSAQLTANKALAKADSLQNEQNQALNQANSAQRTANQAVREASGSE
ncbi:hypothetical protein AB4090_14000 [Acidithiobacillus sp. IBUN Pt1247-S3]|uniref:hypothetical protein n=1 Tax=Acidithiobacillus sp. IBUN Pt1247-S3 TaxID=3166642 RepID=UPI0034E3D5BF